MNEKSKSAAGRRAAQPRVRARPPVRMSVLLPAVFLGAAAAGFVVGSRPSPDPGPPLQATAPFPGQFEGAAFTPDATTDDLLEEAKRVAEEVSKAYPQSPLALSVAARREYLLRNTERAVELWREALYLDPMFADAFFGLGLIMMDRDDYEAAAEYFQEVSWRAPEDPRVPVHLAEALLHAGEVDEAILVLEEHMRAPGASAEALTALGQAYLQAEQFELARWSFERVVQSFPDMKKAVYGLARIYARQGESERAEVYMRRFQELDQEDRDAGSQAAKTFVDKQYATHVAAQAHHDAARVYRKRGDLGKAEQLWRKAAYLEPGSVQYLAQLLQLFESQKRYADCLLVTRRMVEVNASNVDHWLNLGVVQAQLNRPEQALEAFRRAVSLDPDNPRCRQVLEQLQAENRGQP